MYSWCYQSPIPPAMVHCAVEWGLYKEAKERYNYVLAHVRGAHACSKTAISKRGKK